MATLDIHSKEDPLGAETCEKRCFSLQHPGSVWMVRTGSVDMFFQKSNAAGLLGARCHVARLSAGQVMFGVNTSQHPGVAAIASAHPGTILSRMSLADFRDSLVGWERERVLLMLRQWIQALFLAANDSVAPKDSQIVRAGSSVCSGREVIAVVPEEEIAWVKLLRGEFRFGGSEVAVPEDIVFPLSKPSLGWLELLPNSVIFGVDYDVVRFEDSSWHWIDTFHSVIVKSWLVRQERQEQQERTRLQNQREADANRAHKAMSGLASLLQKGHETSTSTTTADPLLAACNAIGSVTGMHFLAASGGGSSKSRKQSVEAIAKASRIRSRRVVLKGEWWKQDCGPLLAFLDDMPVALLPANGRCTYRLYDPVANRSIPVEASVASRLHPFAHTFYAPLAASRLTGRDIVLYALRVGKRELRTVMAMGIMGGALNTAFPVVLGIMFDAVIPAAERHQLFELTALLLACSVAGVIFTLVRSLAVLRLEARVDATVQPALWDRLLRLPSPFFRSFSSGDLAVRSMAMSQIREILTNSTLTAMLSFVFSIFSFGLLFYYHWLLALIATAILFVCFVVLITSSFLLLRYLRQLAPIRGKISSMLLEFVNGISKLRVSGAEGRVFAAWSETFVHQKEVYLKIRRVLNHLTTFNAVLPVCALGVVFWSAGSLQGGSGALHLTTGSFLAFLIAFSALMGSVLQLNSAALSVLSIVPLYERAAPILHTLPEVDEGKAHPGDLRGGLEVSHVSFRYGPDTPLVLQDISFKASPGEFVALTGPSGSGKSTLLRLLLGFEQAESGVISYDGQNVTGIDIEAVRQQIGVVLQNGRLVSGTVFENIVGSLPLSHDQAWEAARLAGLDRDIKAMPMGMHTFISEGGGGLSGGQRQRLMIARAMVNKPRLFLFDEATSALDNTTQAIVSESLETLRATRIVIAHRLSTIINAGQILVFDQGTIVQKGKYAQLAKEPGLFRDLVQRQVV